MISQIINTTAFFFASWARFMGYGYFAMGKNMGVI